MTEEEIQKKLGKHLFLKNITIPNITNAWRWERGI